MEKKREIEIYSKSKKHQGRERNQVSCKVRNLQQVDQLTVWPTVLSQKGLDFSLVRLCNFQFGRDLSLCMCWLVVLTQGLLK